MALWFLIIGFLMSSAAVVGNGFVMYLIVSRQRLHTTANWFVLSLAVADFGFGFSYFPHRYVCRHFIACDRYKRWALSSTLVALSATNLCAMTADRYIAIVKPLKYVIFMTRKRVLFLLSLAWTFPITFHLVFIFTYFFQREERTREVIWDIFTLLDFVFFEIFPCLLLISATGLIFLIARKHSVRQKRLLVQIQFNRPREERKPVTCRHRESTSAHVVYLVVGVFVVCYSTEMFVSFFYELNQDEEAEVLWFLLRLLYVLNSAVNPFAYAFLKHDIKEELKKLAVTGRNTRFRV